MSYRRFVGYRSGACSHDDRVRTVLIVLFAPVPVVLLLVGMAIFRSYPILERKPLRLQGVTSTTQYVGSVWGLQLSIATLETSCVTNL